jgi:hypothetical protein
LGDISLFWASSAIKQSEPLTQFAEIVLALAGIVGYLDAGLQRIAMAFVQSIEYPMCERLGNALAFFNLSDGRPINTSF